MSSYNIASEHNTVAEHNSDTPDSIEEQSNESTLDQSPPELPDEDLFAFLDEVEESGQKPSSFEDSRKDWLEALTRRAIELQEDNNLDLNEADIRFSTALDLRKVRNAKVCIIGAGGLGNWQWRILASMGFRHIIIYDDDSVGLENIGPQAHSIFDMGLPKVEAVANAALQYRGLRILARNKRIQTLQGIREDLGYCPDIIIGCTDSVEFRNGFISMLKIECCDVDTNSEKLPELFLDYRMSLGDWVGYVIPCRALHDFLSTRVSLLHKYMEEAVFSPEAALQEACTERAIAYTGANVAAFTGALLHWFYSGGREYLRTDEHITNFFSADDIPPDEQGSFSWKTSFSARDWESITDTVQVNRLRKKLRDQEAIADRNAMAALNLMVKTRGFTEDDVVIRPWETIAPEDWGAYLGDIFISTEGKTYLIVPGENRNASFVPVRWERTPNGEVDELLDCSACGYLEGIEVATSGVILKNKYSTGRMLRELFKEPEGTVFIDPSLAFPTRLRYRRNPYGTLCIEYCTDEWCKTYLLPGSDDVFISSYHVLSTSQEAQSEYMDRRFGVHKEYGEDNEDNPDPVAAETTDQGSNLRRVPVAELSINDVIFLEESTDNPLQVVSLANGLQVREQSTGEVFYLSRRTTEVFV